ncbi:MAG TPA: hemerythrin domain-containing protein [Bacteroidota bacterium]|jgi:hemerythrin-like domain-containing protein|nr:hemerythrin domain-containing protein [Bacteroidota bacterium]
MKHSTDPIARLMQEHDAALVQLKLLNKAVRGIASDGYTAPHFRRVSSALKFIEEEVSVHNHREEEALFPAIERYVDGPTRIMRDDHKKLQKGFVQLRNAVNELNKHRDSFSANKRLQEVANSVVQLFVNHIHKENHILFPLAQRFLGKEELREIARKML